MGNRKDEPDSRDNVVVIPGAKYLAAGLHTDVGTGC